MRRDQDAKAPSVTTNLKAAQGHLVAQLEEAARSLSEGQLDRLPPTEQQLRSFLELVAQWQHDVEARARRLGLCFPSLTGDLGPWEDLDEQLIQREQRHAHERRRAVGILDRFLLVRHKIVVPFAPLVDCQQEAQSLRERVVRADLGEEAAAIAADLVSGQHRFCTLLDLIDAPADVDEETWKSLLERVQQLFPAKLAIAAVRGFLFIGSSDAAVLAPEQPPVEQAEPVSLPKAELRAPSIEPTASMPVSVPVVEFAPEAATSAIAIQSPADAPRISLVPDRALAQHELEPSSSPSTTQFLVLGEDVSLKSTASASRAVELVKTPASRTDLVSPSNPDPGTEPTAPGGKEYWEALPKLVWKLIEKGNYSLAYHASAALAAVGGVEQPGVPSPWLLRALVIAPHVQGDDGNLAPLLAETLGHHKEPRELGGTSSLARSLLMLAAGLRPSLLAPSTYAIFLLKSVTLPSPLVAVRSLNERIIEHLERNSAINIELLRMLREQESWESALRSLRVETEGWLSHAPVFTATYAPATYVWKRWVDTGGLLHVMASTIIRDDVSQAESVQARLRELADDVRFRKQVNETDRKHRTGGKDIESTALEQLQSRASELLVLAKQWVTLVHHRQHLLNGGYRITSATRLALAIGELAENARRELQGCRNSHEEVAASVCCQAALDNLFQLFDPRCTLLMSEPRGEMILNGELLRMVGIEVAEDWNLVSTPQIVLESFSKLHGSEPMGWTESFSARAAAGDLEGTERILDYLYAQSAWRAEDPEEVEAVAEDLRRSRAGHQRRLSQEVQTELDRLRRDVDTAAALALLQDRGHGCYLSDIEQLEAEIKRESFVRFRWARERIAELTRRLDRLRAPFRTDTERSLAQLRAEQPDHPAIPRIEKVLERGDLLTAREYLNAAESGQTTLEVPEERDSLSEFFPNLLNMMHAASHSTVLGGSHVKALEEGSPVLGLPMAHLTSENAKRAALLLDQWLVLKQPKISQEAATKSATVVMKELGFDVRELQPIKRRTTGARRLGLSVEARPVSDRGRCPVAHYGSSAGGRYNLWLLWNEPSVDEWLSDMEDSSLGVAQIVFWLVPMSEEQRHRLASACQERLRSIIVVDDLLLLYLCSRPESRLRALFDCTLPFTSLKPYVVNGELLPPEMFYGRRREREEVQKTTGTCFIYGGRQLGKTALLHEVRHRVHEPASGRVALYVDLRAHGIGYPHGPDRIWHKLAERLAEHKVVPNALPSNIRGDTLLRHVEEWLSESLDRRVLLLLDEADKFLEADSQDGFVRCAEIKGAMERTGRRFKVVFSGLHNVLRSTRQANHPLAHFGTPICIGPLFQDGEWREARSLAERPLASLGYRFESPDLVMRMLSQVNFYPSLIQLYCDHLLSYMAEVRSGGNEPGPPFIIRERHLDATYRNPRLKEKIRDRFRWTLQLDERYQVIAYAIAYLALGEDQRRVATGFSSTEIRHVSMEHWSEGFTGQGGEDTFVVLLDELVGLGVLHTAGGGKYSLRSPNLMFLLGETEEDILGQLTKKREPPPVYTADTFRAGLGTDHPARLSPLTSRQIAELQDGHGVVLLAGCPAAGLEEVPTALLHAFGKSCIHLKDGPEYGEFARRLDGLVKQRPQDTTTLILVDQSCAYSELWITEALKRVRALTSKTAFLKVAFVADPQILWSILDEDAEGLQRLRDEGARVVSLVPWHDAALRHWLSDAFHSGPNDQAEREQISEVTWNWPSLLQRFHKLCQNSRLTWRDALEELKRQSQSIPAEEFGLDHSGPHEVLNALSSFDAVSESELCDLLAGDVELLTIQRSLRWAEPLALVRQAENGHYRLDPLVRKLVSQRLAARSSNGR